MKYFLFCFMSLCTSMKLPKLCIHCAHFIPNTDNKFGKCKAFPDEMIDKYYFYPNIR